MHTDGRRIKISEVKKNMFKKQNKVALTGAEAVAQAMRQINPDVAAVYPITPQTPIMQSFCDFHANGKVDTELILVESEHSAMSACVGASAAGARVMTATSSVGLALMHEIVFIAASSRLPIVMPVANRALSGPINIHCDHSDTMAERDSGWLQIYAETNQEAYDYTLIAQKVAEDKRVQLPFMVCLDGFITTHCVEGVQILDDKKAKDFVGEYEPQTPLLDTTKPHTFGPLALTDYFFEFKKQQDEAINNSKNVVAEAFKKFEKISNRKHDFIEKYSTEDAEQIIILMSSSAGTTKDVIDELRKTGKKVGLLKINLFRPFPKQEIIDALQKAKTIAVLDRANSPGAYGPPLFNEIRNIMYESQNKPAIISYVYGLGGRDYTPTTAKKIFTDLENYNPKQPTIRFIGVRE